MPTTIHDKKLLQNKVDYRNMARFDSTRKLYTAVETAEHVCTQTVSVQPNIGQSKVCTSPDEKP